MEKGSKVSINIEENRMYITLIGSFDNQDSIHIINEINAQVTKLKPGFDVINDIQKINYTDISSAIRIKKGISIIEQHGVKRIVRIIGGSALSLKIFAKFTSLANKNTKVHYVPSMEKAKEILEKS